MRFPDLRYTILTLDDIHDDRLRTATRLFIDRPDLNGYETLMDAARGSGLGLSARYRIGAIRPTRHSLRAHRLIIQYERQRLQTQLADLDPALAARVDRILPFGHEPAYRFLHGNTRHGYDEPATDHDRLIMERFYPSPVSNRGLVVDAIVRAEREHATMEWFRRRDPPQVPDDYWTWLEPDPDARDPKTDAYTGDLIVAMGNPSDVSTGRIQYPTDSHLYDSDPIRIPDRITVRISRSWAGERTRMVLRRTDLDPLWADRIHG